MRGDPDLAAVAGLIGEPARARMLVALVGGRELAAGLLADEAGVSRSTASAHLARLVDGGLLAVRASGRHRHYRLAGPAVAELLERMLELSPALPVSSLRGSRRARTLRVARTCYDHVAGQVGVGMMTGLLERGYLDGGGVDGGVVAGVGLVGTDRPAAYGHEVDYRLTSDGQAFLDRLGVRLPASRRPLVRYCVDWTETRHHLAGRLGRGLHDRMLDLDWLRPGDSPRALVVTPEGTAGLERELGVRLDDAG